MPVAPLHRHRHLYFPSVRPTVLQRPVRRPLPAREGFEHCLPLFNAILATSSAPAFGYEIDNSLINLLSILGRKTAGLLKGWRTRYLSPLTNNNRLCQNSPSVSYLIIGMRPRRDILPDLGSTNNDAVFMTSLLLAYQCVNLIPDRPMNSTCSPVTWFRTVQNCPCPHRAVDAVRLENGFEARQLHGARFQRQGSSFRGFARSDQPYRVRFGSYDRTRRGTRFLRRGLYMAHF